MMYLHKLLPTFFLPIGLVLVVLIIAAVKQKRTLVYAGAGLLFLFSMPLVSNLLFRAVEHFASRPVTETAQHGDAIVVLSGMLTASPLAGGGTIVEWGDPDRFFAGIELLKSGKAPLLVFTGGQVPWLREVPPEGDVLKPYAIQAGISPEQILVTSTAENTEDEAREVSRQLGVGKTVILVTSAFHMSRAKRLFSEYGLVVIPFPVDFRSGGTSHITIMDLLPSATSLLRSETAMRELLGQAFYEVKLALHPPQG